jgi:uncharacterized OB-fold protein
VARTDPVTRARGEEVPAWKGPRPNPSLEMQPFWDGMRRREFLLMRCAQCGAWRWPVAGCRDHPNGPYLDNLVWTPASGRGRVFAYTVQQALIDPAFDVPYVYAIVELDEGPVMPTNIVNCRPEDVRVGLPVRVVFSAIGGDDVLPVFEPAP